MKSGDKFICIKEAVELTSNKEYQLLNIDSADYTYNSGQWGNHTKFWFRCNDGRERFVMDYCFNQYFMTLKEYRKTKLRRINGITM